MNYNIRLLFAIALSGAFVGGGLAVAGQRIADAVKEHPKTERHVAVKGLSERQVRADRATFVLTATTSSESLENLQSEIDRSLVVMRNFVLHHGLVEEEIELQQTIVTDNRSNPYATQHGAPRYQSRCGIVVRSTKVEEVSGAARDLNHILRQGLILEATRPSYVFSGLNSIKPEMLAEATQNARLAAEEFARASEAQVGSIRHARQGVFSIRGRGEVDPQSGIMDNGSHSIEKKVRVVSTIDFSLE